MSYNGWNAEDDHEWQNITWADAKAAGILHLTTEADATAEDNSFIPTPERHYAGDNIYFVTGDGGEHSAQAGFAEVMLSQSRDGVSLKKNKQYYLREVLEPSGHLMENIYWRFIIGDNDDWDNYVYSDDSILQVSNASEERVLTVRKTVIDRTAEQRITYDDVQKNIKFQVRGTSLTDSNNVIYNKIVTYDDFMRVDTRQPDGSTKTEYLLTISKLKPGNYTVREVRSSAFTDDNGVAPESTTNLSTSVEGDATVKHLNNDGTTASADTTEEANFAVKPDDDTTTEDMYFTFTVPDSDQVTQEQTTPHTETFVNAEFTNTYTDKDAVSITVGKSWHPRDEGNEVNFIPIRAEFELYADGKKFDLDTSDGGNERGNIEVDASGTTKPWTNQVTINNLPKKRTVKTTDADGKVTYTASDDDIVWTVKEVRATYRTNQNALTDPTIATDEYLREHFTISTNTQLIQAAEGEVLDRYAVDASGNVQFTDTFNNLTTVKVQKTWSDNLASNLHSDDVVSFDLYRTTTDITSYTENQLRDLVAGTASASPLMPVVKDIELRYDADPAKSFAYENELMEKVDNNGAAYYYFVLEHSVAGYDDSYSRTNITDTTQAVVGQAITITNTPSLEAEGNLVIEKVVTGAVPDNLNKTFTFTLQNSGKYVQADGTLAVTKHEFEIQPGAENKVTIDSVKLGTYTLAELESDAKINGYTLTSATVAVNGANGVNIKPSGLEGEVEVTTDMPTTVVITNTYETDDSENAKTDFTFGKLWIMPAPNPDDPNAGDTRTLPWPNDISVTMNVYRRVKGSDGDGDLIGTYTISQPTTDALSSEIYPDSATLNAKPLVFSNPDVMNGKVKNDQGVLVDAIVEDPLSYHQYAFTLEDLPKYDANGTEWEYFAKETAVTDTSASHSGANLQDSGNATGRYFTEHYGIVDGIGARVLADEQTANSSSESGSESGTVTYTENDTSVAGEGNTGYVINRLSITDKAVVPVKKFINGWPNWGEKDTSTPPEFTTDYTYPGFTFKLYTAEGDPVIIGGELDRDANGKAQYNEDGTPKLINNEGCHLSVTTDNKGKATFDIPESAIDLTKLMWWSDEKVLSTTQNFWIREVNEQATDPVTGAVTSISDVTKNYGIKYYSGSARVNLTIKFDWMTGKLKSMANVSGNEYVDESGIEWGVINNTYDPGKTTVTVNKTWNDENNQDGYRRATKFKVHAKYYVGTGGNAEGGAYQTLDKVWFVKDEKTRKVSDAGVITYVNEKVQDEIILNDTSTPYDASKEYRITLDPPSSNSSDTSTTTVTLPKYYEGHLIIYTVEEMLSETTVEPGVTLAGKYTKSVSGTPTLTGDERNVTNTHTPEKVNVNFEKTWEGSDQSGVDPTVTVQLKAKYGNTTIANESDATRTTNWASYANDFAEQTVTKGVIESDKWIYRWQNLPRYAPGSAGKQVTYTVEEVETSIPVGYHQTGNNKGNQIEDTNNLGTYDQSMSIENTYVPINIPIKKVWVDDDNRDNLRPTSVTYSLTAKVGDTVIAGKDGDNIIIGNLKYQDGTEVTAADLSKTLSSSTDIGTDNDNNTWESAGWVGLPKYYNGKEIDYIVTEDPLNLPTGAPTDAYASTTNHSVTTVGEGDSAREQDLYTFTNTHEIYTTQLTLTKTWVDQNNQDGKRPNPTDFVSNYIHLRAQLTNNQSNAPTELKVGELKQGSSDTYLVMYDADNNSETPLVQFSDAEVTIQGNNGAYTLDSSGGAEQLAAYNKYTITYKQLPRYRGADCEIEYSFRETPPTNSGYYRVTSENQTNENPVSVDTPIEISIDGSQPTARYGDATGTASVMNKYDPEHISLTVAKAWKHGANYSPAAETATIQLVATSDSSRIDSETGWHDKGYVINPVQTLSGSYVENDESTSSATCYWQTLPKNMPGRVGEPVTYSIEESDVPDGYYMASPSLSTNELPNKSKEFIAVTNTFEETEVTATKVWKDANNQDGLRKPVKFKLQNRVGTSGEFKDVGGAEVKTISTTDSQQAVWENLLAWKNNQRVYYQVMEVPEDSSATLESCLPGYTTTHGSFSYPPQVTRPAITGGTPTYEIVDIITNAHTPQTYTVTATKTWDHKGVEFNLNQLESTDPRTLENYKNKLHLWARVKNSDNNPVEVKDDGWDSNWGTGSAWLKLFVNNPGTEQESRDNNWKSHADVTSSSATSTSYVVTISDLPLYKPQSTEVASENREELEYFIGEDEGDITHYTMATTPAEIVGSNKLVKLTDNSGSIPAPLANAQLKNERDTGSLKITKTVTSDLAADHTQGFNFKIETTPDVTTLGTGYSYTITNAANNTVGSGNVGFTNGKLSSVCGVTAESISLSSGQTLTITGLPVGVTYTVTEVGNTNFNTEPTSAVIARELAAKDAVGNADFTNTRKPGVLKVTKSMISPDNADKIKDFTFTVTLDGLTKNATANSDTKTFSNVTFTRAEDSESFVGTFTLHNGQEKVFDDLPTGAEYTVTETPVDNYSMTKTGDTGTISTSSSTAAFTNTRDSGELKITKTLEHYIPSDEGDVFYFDVQLKDEDDANLPLIHDNQALIKVNNSAITEIGSDESVPQATETNPYPTYCDMTTGCIHNVKVALGGTNTATTTISGLPQGAKYEVAEKSYFNTQTTPGNITINGTGTNATGTIAATQTTSFINARSTGSLSIKKVVDSPVSDDRVAGRAYAVTVSLKTKHKVGNEQKPVSAIATVSSDSTSPSNSQTSLTFTDGRAAVYVHNGETVTLGGIPTDVDYEVAESGEPLFAKAYAIWDATQGKYVDTAQPKASGTINATTPAQTQITNTRGAINITASKTWADNNNQDGIRPESIKYTLESKVANGAWTQVGESQVVTVAQDDAGTASYEWTNLPTYQANGQGQAEQITYRVVETGITGETGIKGYTSSCSPEYVTGSQFERTQDANVDFTNTHTPEVISVSATKVWEDGGDQDGLRADVTLTLEAAVGDEDPARVTVDQNNDALNNPQTIVNSNDATQTVKWDKLPKYRGGTLVTYRVVESDIAERDDLSSGYTTTYSPTTISGSDGTITVKNAHTPETVCVDVAKVWDDLDDANGHRPNSLDVHLYKQVEGQTTGGEGLTPVTSKTLTLTKDDADAQDANTWRGAITGLPKYEGGHLVTYIVREETPEHYDSHISGNTVVDYDPKTTDKDDFSYTLTNASKTKLTVTKYWQDGGIGLADSLKSVTVQLQRKVGNGSWSNVDGTTAELTASTSWAATWNDLPRIDVTSGAMIEYRAIETFVAVDDTTGAIAVSYMGDDELAGTVGGFSYASSTAALTKDGYVTNITNTLRMAGITVNKAWHDDDNRDGYRPERLIMTLTAHVNGSAYALPANVSDTVTLSATNEWSDVVTWSQLPIYDEAGQVIIYEVTENGGQLVAHYTDDENGLVQTTSLTKGDAKLSFANTHEVRKTAVRVAKVFDDADNQDGVRPEAVVVELYANGAPTGRKLTLRKSNGWSASFDDLNEMQDGEVITYTVVEDGVEGYVAQVAGDATEGYTITGVHAPKKVSATITKSWSDHNDVDNKRPKSVTIELVGVAKGKTLVRKTVELTEDNNWSAQLDDLDAYYQGTEISYSVTETTELPSNYSAAVSGSLEDGFTIASNYEPPYGFVNVDGQSSDKQRLGGATLRMYGKFLSPDGTIEERELVVMQGGESATTLEGYRFIEGETYTLVNTDVPAGYVCFKPVIITVDENGKLVIPSDSEGQGVISKDGYSITVAEKPTTLSVSKTDLAGEPITASEAQFSIEPEGAAVFANVDEPSKPITAWGSGLADALSGHLCVSKLHGEDGKLVTAVPADASVYALREVVAPMGYQIVPETVRFVLDEYGRPQLVKRVASGYEIDNEYYGTAVALADDMELVMRDPANKVQLKKFASDTKQNLEGATYRIAGKFADGSEVQTITGSTTTPTMLDRLLVGGNTYTIVEATAPEGYEIDDTERVFTIDDEGTIEFVGNAGGYTAERVYDESQGQWISVISQTDDPIAAKQGKTDDKAKTDDKSKTDPKPGTSPNSKTSSSSSSAPSASSSSRLASTGDAGIHTMPVVALAVLGVGGIALGIRRKQKRT